MGTQYRSESLFGASQQESAEKYLNILTEAVFDQPIVTNTYITFIRQRRT